MILPKEDKTVATLTVPEDKLEMVMGKETANKPDSEPPDTAQEIAKLESQLAELEDKQQQNGEKFTERLRSIDTTLAELRGIVKASSLFVQGQGVASSAGRTRRRYG